MADVTGLPSPVAGPVLAWLRAQAGEHPDKVQRLGLFGALVLEPPGTGHGEVGAGRVSDHEVPAPIEALGHTSIALTASVYAHVISGLMQEAGAKLEKELFR